MKTQLKYGLTTTLFFIAVLCTLFSTNNKPTRSVRPPPEFKEKLPQGHSNIIPRLIFFKSVHDIHLTSGASLQAFPKLIENGGKVMVKWNHVSIPRHSKPYDWIGVYCPLEAHKEAYLDYAVVNTNPTFVDGYGSVDFTLYNLRTDCE